MNHIIQWNEKYIIAVDYKNKSFKVIDYENNQNNQVILNIYFEHQEIVPCIKKVYHPNYGESLLTASLNNTIRLWTFDN